MQILKRLNLFCTALCCLLLLSQCKQKDGGSFTVTVKYKNADKLVPQFFNQGADTTKSTGNKKIRLEEIPYGGDMNPILLDSSTLTASSGTVTLNGNSKEEGIFQVIVEDGPVMLLINDGTEINVDLDLSKRDNYYTVTGSAASNELKDFIQTYSDKSYAVNKAFSELDSLKHFNPADSVIIPATEKKNKEIEGINSYLKSFISKTEHPAIALFALGMSSRSLQKAEFENELNTAVKKFPQYKTLASLKSTYDMQQAQREQQQKLSEANSAWTNKPAPELSLPEADGKLVSLASFKGKYVLVDFWASWCGPCRIENPNVVKVYNQFKDKNFTILGVSLDKEKAPWLEAIKKDHLTWTHVSDLQYWNSKAVETFKFEGIPYNVLIDPQGKIIAEGLRGNALEEKLSEILN